MKSKQFILTPLILALLLILFIFINKIFFDNVNLFPNFLSKNEMKIPEGELLTESTSEDGKYTIKAYLCNGGVTVDWAVRGELIENNTSKKPHNIYWDYHINKADITWEDNDTVIINNHKIDLPNGTYDWRDN